MISLDEAKWHLRIDGDYDDAWLSFFIEAVSEAIISWLGSEKRIYKLTTDNDGDVVEVIGTDGLPIIHPLVKAAALVELANQYRFRESEGGATRMPENDGYILSKGATDLLVGLRKPLVT